MSLSQRKEKLIRRLRTRRGRPREGLFLVEGLRGCEVALRSGAELRFAVRTERLGEGERGRALIHRFEEEGVPVATVTEGELEGVSDTESPQGLLLVCVEPPGDLTRFEAGPSSRFLLLDGVQDPGNLGTLIRGAAAFEMDAVVALDGTVDPWNPKAVRASAGGIFRVPVTRADWEEEGRRWLRERGIRLLVADAGGRDVASVRPLEPWALVVGNEGAGSRAEVREAAKEMVAVPMSGGADSLNVGVAGSILLYVLSREGRGD